MKKSHAIALSAMVANEYDRGGYAAKAEEFLRKAEAKMRMAAEAANKNKK